MRTYPKTRREVHGLDYAICVLVSILDSVFHGHCDWWNIDAGLDIEVHDRRGDSSKDLLVKIHPVGWRNDECIWARFDVWGRGGWRPFEGHVDSCRLPAPLGFQFGFQTNWPAPTLRTTGDSATEFLRKVRPDWFKDAQPA